MKIVLDNITSICFNVVTYSRRRPIFITAKKVKNRTYYYLVENQRVNGKPRAVQQIYLGRAQDVYNRLFRTPLPKPQEVKDLSFGDVASLWDQAKQLDLISLIDSVIPQRSTREVSLGTYLVAGAINRAVNPKSKDGIGPWMGKTVLPRLMKLPASTFDSQSFWDAFDLVEDSHIEQIEEKLWAKTLKLYGLLTDVLLWDTTNFATHIDALTPSSLPQRGRPKRGSPEQRLIGMGLASTPVLGLPFLHKLYEGNLHDAKLFPEAISLITKRYSLLRKKTERLTLIFDKGNNSRENIQEANRKGVACVGALHPSHFPRLLKIPLSEYTEVAGEYRVHRTKAKVFEAKRTVVITFHQKLFERQMRTLKAKIERVKGEILSRFAEEEEKDRYRHSKEVLLKCYQDLLHKKRLSEFLSVKITGKRQRRLSIKVNQRAIKARQERFGKTIIFSDRDDWSTEQIIDAYHGKRVNEENFRFLKDRHYLHFEPLYHWTDQKIKVHALMCVLSLLLVKLLLYRASKAKIEMSLPLLLMELGDIKEIVWLYPNQQLQTMVTTLSTVQRNLFDLFGLSQYTNTS